MWPTSCSSKPLILIVDDDASVCRTLAMIFEREGYRVTTACETGEAHALLKRVKPDLVITELDLGEVKAGFKVVRAAQKLDPRPVIVVSVASPAVLEMESLMGLGVDHLAFKPSDVQKLISTVALLLSRRANALSKRA
jgi:DNA-binding response OmpR family regulator